MRVRLPFTVALFAALAAATLPAQRGPQKPPADLKQFTFQVKSFKSAAVNQEISYGVFLPKDYDAEANKKTVYPLAIWLHGMFEDHNRFHDRGGAPVLDAAVAEGLLPPCVFVCAYGGRTSMYVNRKNEKWEDLITKDLLEHLSQNYRVSPDRSKRALMGISMGGMAALKIAFTYPELFGTVAVHSSAVLPEDPDQLPERMKGMAKRIGLDEVFGDPIDKAVWEKANPLCLAAKAKPADLKGLRIYFDAGTEDRLNFGESNKVLHEVLDKQKIEHTWELVQGGGHAWGSGFKESSLMKSLTFVGQAFGVTKPAAKDPKPGKDDGKGEKGPDKGAEKSGEKKN